MTGPRPPIHPDVLRDAMLRRRGGQSLLSLARELGTSTYLLGKALAPLEESEPVPVEAPQDPPPPRPFQPRVLSPADRRDDVLASMAASMLARGGITAADAREQAQREYARRWG